MQTPSHFLITAVVNYKLKERAVAVHSKALLVGSVLPDIPFFLLTMGGEIYYRWLAPLPVEGSIMEYLHLDLFFNDPVWIISHNFFHAPFINSLLLLLGWWGWQQEWRWGWPLFWLAVGTQFHTILDIFTHHSDGPLLLFPFEWQTRFASPISYWEADQYGVVFMVFEYTLNLFIVIYFLRQWWLSR
jgi:membrane-bound metal-dependent hydrolase YbcI (DUF457 family)